MEILDLIEKLEQIATQSKKVPLTGKTMLNPDQLLELVDQMRLAVPRGVREAQDVLDRREQVINQALSDAKRTKAAADTESRTRLEESELVRAAKRRYDEIIQQGEEEGRRLMERVHAELQRRRGGADQYAQEVLSNLEHEVNGVLSAIHRGIDALLPKEELASRVNGGTPAKSEA